MITYALPTLPLAIVVFPAYAILPTFYARHTKIPLSTIGLILIASRVFDAIVDPAIGYLSDNTRSHWGPRKPWLVVGAAVLVVATYELYVPATGVDALYYGGWCLLFFLGFTLIDIPHKAWGTDIARSYLDRSAISTYLGASFAVGNLAFAVVPFLPGLAGHSYDAATLRIVAILAAILLPLSVGVSLWFAPSGQPVAAARPRLGSLLRSAATNRPFTHFLSIFLLAGFGQGIFYSLVFMLVGAVEGLGAAFPIILLTDAVATFVAIPVWFRIIARIEKHRAWAVGMIGSGLAISAVFFVPPGAAGLLGLLTLITLRALGGAVIYVAPHALLGDVVDYDILKSRTNPAGNFNAAVTLVTKANGAIGGGLGLVLIGLVGFSAKGGNGSTAIINFKLIVLILPALLLFASSAAAWAFPLDRRRHDIVRRRILSRVDEDAP
jgi:Na+/melibiose symporter-like transporter